MRRLQNPFLFACYTIVLQGLEVFGADYCYVGGTYVGYCEDGYHCCNNDTDCCADLTVGAIIGIVFACIFVVSLCVVCILIIKKKKSRQGTVVTPGQQQTVTVQSVSHQPPQGYNQGYSQPYGQQPYGGPSMGQPQYGMAPPPYQAKTQDPVYPPPPPPVY